MAIEESGLLTAVANWIGTIGVPAMFVWNWRLVQWQHKQDLAIAELQSQMRASLRLEADVKDLAKTLQDVHGIVRELKTDIKYMERRGSRDRRDDNEPRA